MTLDPPVAKAPISGRLFVFVSQRGGEPRVGPDWFAPEPFFGMNVHDFRPGTSRRVTDAADGFPAVLGKLPPGQYRVQALLAHNFDRSSQGAAAGNQFSKIGQIEITAGPVQTVSLVLDQINPERKFPESKWIREVRIASRLLGQFQGAKSRKLPRSYYRLATTSIPSGVTR